jgi:hypothetical protein
MKYDITNKTINIIKLEWEMFSNVNNIGGRASCQESPETFRIMRESQAVTWSQELLESYLEDLKTANEEGRNLMTEKYARMMKYTHPDEYENIKNSLPPINENVSKIIEEIVKINLEWDEVLANKYPYLKARGRKTYSYEDTPYGTSIETYLRGELQTYSEKTIEIYYNYVIEQKSKNINLKELNLLNMIKYYGYESLESANDKVKQNK